MDLNLIGFKRAIGVNYSGILKKFPKNQNKFQPLFEAITNSLEALRQNTNSIKNEIKIRLNREYKNRTNGDAGYDFISLEVIDFGIGLNDEQFNRFLNLNDTSKGFHNRGSGRIQYLHFFDRTTCESFFKITDSTNIARRLFVLSKSDEFLRNNAILNLESFELDSKASHTETRIKFQSPLTKSDEEFFSKLTAKQIKVDVVKRYLPFLIENVKNIPTITIEEYIGENLFEKLTIDADDIPTPNDSSEIRIKLSKFENDGKELVKLAEESVFHVTALKCPKNELDKNGVFLVSKGEIATELDVDCLRNSDIIEDCRYLVLVSGEYINENDGDDRGDIKLISSKDIKKGLQLDILNSEIVLKEDLQQGVKSKIEEVFPEILDVKKEKEKSVDELQKLFLLNEETVKSISINLNDTDQDILKKVYAADSISVAKKDAEIKVKLEKVKSLDTTSEKYEEDLEQQVDDVVKMIPLQNRTALTHYVARRRIVLEIFDKILSNELARQNTGARSINEKLLHNLIFQQSSNDPSKSDLWLINEDFIYFKGCSEFKLSEVKLEGELVFRDDIDAQEEKMLNALGENRRIKKPDILLFPSEGRAIIIELKASDVNVSEYLNQIPRYASLLRKFSKSKYELTQFYGYLIGEAIDNEDVRDHDSDFRSSYQLDYLFRARKAVNGLEGQRDGDLYMEVIKYSTLLKRAQARNKVFIDKILGK